MRNLELALAFERIADLLEFLGESPFKIRAYRRVARTLMELAEPIEQVAAEGRLRTLPGVGEAIAAKVEQYLRTGAIELLERLKEQVPEGVVELTQIPGVGPRTARLLSEQLGVRSVAELEEAARDGRVRTVKGMGARTEQAILEGIQRWRARAGRLALPYLLSAAEAVAASLEHRPGIGRVALAGSVRRAEETGSDVDLVVEGLPVETAARGLEGLGPAEPGLWPGTLRVRGPGPGGARVDVWVVPPAQFAAACLVATGPSRHVEGLLRRLEARGFRLEQGQLVGPDGAAHPVTDEATLYRLVGLVWVPPELRWGEDELELAERGELPARLVEVEDIRGDLHTHTDASDGTAPAREMAEAARARGLEYLAITDHSPSLTVARGLSVERLQAQVQTVRALDAEMRQGGGTGPGPGPKTAGRGAFRVLAGSEVDVLPDGSLDYPSDVLAGLDVVIASVHSQMRQSRDEMTRRLLAACEHPHVHILGHPTGRLLGRRDPYEVDMEAVIDRAAETGTVLEINASPDRLDLCARWARAARRRGVRLVIGTDAHSPAQLAFMRYGVLVARRAGLGPEDVLNTRPLEELLAQLK